MGRICMKANVRMRATGMKPALRLVFSFAIAVALAGASYAAPIYIGGSAFAANGQLARDHQYTGSCPVSLKFDWGVVTEEPMTASYSFVRSDGGHSSTSQSINLPGGGRSVPIIDEWRLGANTPQFENYSGWVEINIESPRGMIRQRMPFTIHCSGEAAGVRIGGSAFSANGMLARDYQYTGPCPVNLKFDWGVIGTEPATVTYSFLRNDGGHSSNLQSIYLPSGNRSVPILDDWRLGANTPQFQDYHGWVELHIESPNRLSNRIAFTIHCQ